MKLREKKEKYTEMAFQLFVHGAFSPLLPLFRRVESAEQK